ncbi:MAG TPA: LPXTG cell wall anchor domain-containing protein [Acidimicrobiales bacterium]
MEQHVSSRRRVAGGLTCAAAGALALVLGVGSPAGATGGPEVETGPGWTLDDLAERFGGQWVEAEIPMESGRHLLDDRGTPDTSDDAYVDIRVEDGEVTWSSDSVEIGAIEVPGEGESHLFTYGGGHGSRHGEFEWGGHDWGDWGGHGDRGGHGWGDRDREGRHGWGDHGRGDHGRRRGHFRFCWKDRPGGHPTTTVPHPTTSAPPEETTTTTAPPEETTTTAPSEETTTTAAPSTTLPATESSTPTTTAPGGELPQTGSSTTVPLVVGGLALLGLGAAAFFGRRFLQQRA